jgi:hypothetical protein
MLTNFTLMEFDELTTLVVPTIVNHAQSIGGHYNLFHIKNLILNVNFGVVDYAFHCRVCIKELN